MDEPRRDERNDDGTAELAEFAPAPVGGRRRRNLGPIVAGSWVVVLAAVVGVGIFGRGAGPGDGRAPSQVPAVQRPQPSVVAEVPAPVASGAPSRPNVPNLLVIQVGPTAGGIAVSGTVRSRSVASVLVSVHRADGSVSWRSLAILGGALQGVSGPSFLVRFDLANPVAGAVAWVEANAYNDVGRKVASVRQPIGQPTDHYVVRAKTSLVR